MRRLVFSFWSLNWFEKNGEKMERIEDMVISREKQNEDERKKV
tara:strand:+ start:134 stop:262 length:129 start_codon:yes stop_codon:yes gene_type:complete